jgi:hypothetical protein
MGGGVYGTDTQASLVVHALRQLDIELLPTVTWSAGEYRYARQLGPMAAGNYYGKLTANSVSATLRASYTFTPQLTLQAYAQAYLASGHFDDLRPSPLAGGPGTEVTLAALQAATPMDPTGTVDFQSAALNINVVFRWEYRLGSTIYFVYSRSQIPTVPISGFTPPAMLDPRAFGHGGTSDVFLLKFSSWWAS